MSGNLKNAESNGQRGQTKTTEVAVSTTRKTQFRNRIFLFPFSVFEKEDVARLDEERGGT